MRIQWVFVGMASIAAAAAPSWGQCTWTSIPTPSLPNNADGVMVYHSGLQRALFIMTYPWPVSVYAWDGAQWTLMNGMGPTTRHSAGVVYDSARGRVVMFGGNTGSWSGGFLGDTVEWDGANWTLEATTGPQARAYPAMAYDAAHQKTVMFGGNSSAGYLGDTWEWDGHTWMQVASTGPSARASRACAYDSNRQKIVMCGGEVSSGYFMDVWEWDGAWSQRATTNLPGPAATWMAFDPDRGSMILGRATGSPNPNSLRETWELDMLNGQWFLRDPGTAPWSSCAFDIARSRAVTPTKEYDPAGTEFPAAVVEQPIGVTMNSGAPLTLHVGTLGTPPLSFQWRRSGYLVKDGGSVSGAMTDTLTISPSHVWDTGQYSVWVGNACGSVVSDVAGVRLTPACYANCDDSTSPPILNANDFQCFMNMFAAENPYANCDSAGPPLFTANDFQCFLNRFAAGCS